MAKKKKKRSGSGLLAYANSLESTKAAKDTLKRFNWKRALILILTTAAAFAVLETVISFEAQAGLSFSIITLVYYLIITGLVLAILILNRGFSKAMFTPDMLDPSLSEEEAASICETLNRHKGYAKRLMPILLPFLFAVFFDIIYLFYGDILASIFKFLVPGAA